MIIRFTMREKLQMYYVELDRLEAQLALEIRNEIAIGKHALKQSKITRYKISTILRATKKMESLVNAKAEKYENWEYNRHDIETNLGLEMDEIEELSQVIYSINERLNAANGMDMKELTKIGMLFTDTNQKLLRARDIVNKLTRELNNHMKRRPEQASRVSREQVMAELHATNVDIVPEALEAMARQAARQAQGSINEGEFIFKPAGEPVTDAVRALLEPQLGPISDIENQDFVPLKHESDTDVSFMFKDFKSQNLEESKKEAIDEGAAEATSVQSDNLDANKTTSDSE